VKKQTIEEVSRPVELERTNEARSSKLRKKARGRKRDEPFFAAGASSEDEEESSPKVAFFLARARPVSFLFEAERSESRVREGSAIQLGSRWSDVGRELRKTGTYLRSGKGFTNVDSDFLTPASFFFFDETVLKVGESSIDSSEELDSLRRRFLRGELMKNNKRDERSFTLGVKGE